MEELALATSIATWCNKPILKTMRYLFTKNNKKKRLMKYIDVCDLSKIEKL